VEGSIAKYFATEAGDAAANDAIQAFGGYGYMREYEVEKIKRDVKILTIYEGTSEIQRNIISLFRTRETVRSKGGFYRTKAETLDKLGPDTGGSMVAKAMRVLNDLIVTARKKKLNRHQYVMFLLADMMTWSEVAEALCHKASSCASVQGRWTPDVMKATARLFARETVEKALVNALKVLQGYGEPLQGLEDSVRALDLSGAMVNMLSDMDVVAKALVA
jgi:alkylation response protein AidB-like acyl-CoA dehydrogenase